MILSRKQRILRNNHGAPQQFEDACFQCLGEISVAEAKRAVTKYRKEFKEAGNFKELESFQKVVTSIAALGVWVGARRGFAKIVVTNGCFDVLHAGHIHLLEKARQLGDYLIVLLNSDKSVKRLKGPDRPINCALDRATVLSALECVDLVFIFNETEITPWITRIKPAAWAKGGDYTLRKLNRNEVRAARKVGCKICLTRHIKGLSTSKLYEKIRHATKMDQGHASPASRSRRLQRVRS